MIAIVDYGVGNVRPVANMLRKAGGNPVITGDPETLQNAKAIILPGVGSFDAAMNELDKRGLRDILEKKGG